MALEESELILSFNDVRKKLNNPEIKIDESYLFIGKICYLFGLDASEVLAEKKRGYKLLGKNIYQDTINNIESLCIEVPTVRQGRMTKKVLIPLNPAYEEWSKEILEISEDNYNKPILYCTKHALQDNIKKLFEGKYWINTTTYNSKTKKSSISELEPFTVSNLVDIRKWELVLCHNFTPYDVKVFIRDARAIQDYSYIDKLIIKKDIYIDKDIKNAIVLQNKIFNPSDDSKYNCKQYVEIYKLIKKGLIELSVDTIPIDLDIDIKQFRNEKKEHAILKANIMKHFVEQGDNEVIPEKWNYDVISPMFKTVVECGQTYGDKLSDLFNDSYENLNNFQWFWIIDFYGDDRNSKLYKFKKVS